MSADMPNTVRRRRGLGYVQILIVVALVVMLAVALLAVVQRSRERSHRTMCANYLKPIGFAMLLYANENRGAFPRTLYVPDTAQTPVWGTGADEPDPFAPAGPRNDVSAVLFLLIRTQDVTSEIFICPSSRGEKDTYGGQNRAVTRSNFTDMRRNLSYSIQNPYPAANVEMGETWWQIPFPEGFAVAADISPGLAGKKDNVLHPSLTSGAKDMKFANSNNHGGDGQNVLFGDGHVQFHQNPFVGVQRDHIFTNRRGQVVASPVDATDSVLLPTDD